MVPAFIRLVSSQQKAKRSHQNSQNGTISFCFANRSVARICCSNFGKLTILIVQFGRQELKRNLVVIQQARVPSHGLKIAPRMVVEPTSISNRIVNGNEAAEGQFPYQVSVLAQTTGGRFYVCGGSIITRQWVLSAAHCTYPHSEFILRFGSNDLWANGQMQRTTEVVNHPEYNQDTLNNDVSLLKIPTPLDLTGGTLRSVRLPYGQLNDQQFIGNRSRVAGWGIDNTGTYSNRLNFVDMAVIDNPTCADVFGDELVIDGVLCASGYKGREQGLCGGDSGSALVALHEGQWIQIGIGAFGALEACEQGHPSGFTRVTTYNTWIKQTVGLPTDEDDDVPPLPEDEDEEEGSEDSNETDMFDDDFQ